MEENLSHHTPYTIHDTRTKRGFTILLAALVASLVLALGLSVFTIAQKQLVLSSTGRNSQYAFYAADSAAECALFHDSRNSAFATSSPITPISCNNTSIAVASTDLNVLPVTFSFSYDANGYCAQVEVVKSATHPRTAIHANGFSVACSDVDLSSRVLQRSVELTY